MSIAILGGLDRLKSKYERIGKDMGVDIRLFSQRVPDMGKRLSGVNGIVVFTDTISHPMVSAAARVAKQNNIPVTRSHTSSLSALKRCIADLALV